MPAASAPQDAAHIALVGATGTVGRHVAAGLHARGVGFRAIVRDPAQAARLLASVLPPGAIEADGQGRGIRLMHGDLKAPEDLGPALEGVERLYLATNVHPHQVALQISALAAARVAGVRHVVKLSNLGADSASDFPTAAWHGKIENLLEHMGLAWTHLRPHAFMQNLLAQLPAVRETGELAGAYGEARISMVDARDVADVAVAALTEDGHAGQAYDLTGPAGLSFADVAEALAAALGRPVRYTMLSFAEHRERMIAGGRPDWYADALLVLYHHWAQGGWDRVSDAVARVTGRPPRDLATFLADHAGTLAGA